MAGGGWGSRDVPTPVEMYRTGQVGPQILRPRLGLEGEPAIDDAEPRIPEPRGDRIRRPEELRAREGAHRDNLAVLRGNIRRGLDLVRLRTDHGPPLVVTLYERAGCHLCDKTHRALRRIGLDRALAIERVDIASDPELERRYLVRIPVLAAGPAELDAANLSDREIAAWLDSLPAPSA